MNILLKNATIVTQNDNRSVFKGDIWVSGNQIKDVAERIEQPDVPQMDLSGSVITPGLIQSHIHLCQVLFRNFADDLELLDWLSRYIWPMEMHHSPETLRASAQLGLFELLSGGVTTVLDMGCASHMDVVFEELQNSGIRAFCGKVMMDAGDQPYQETTRQAIESTEILMKRWHGAADGRIQYALAPRFALTCSNDLWEAVKDIGDREQLLIHTHSSENQTEIRLVQEQTGLRNIDFFVQQGLASERLCLAHCIWLEAHEMQHLQDFDIKVLHCPAANLKLGSGFANIPAMLRKGISVAIGSDGAPCNNNLDMLMDMRLAALIHKPNHGVRSITAGDVFDMATIGGARTLGMSDRLGSIEPGKLADLAVWNLNKVHCSPVDNIISQIVYSSQSRDISDVMVNGEWVVRERLPVAYPDEQKIVETAGAQCRQLLERIDSRN